jgi:hypothetical protein
LAAINCERVLEAISAEFGEVRDVGEVGQVRVESVLFRQTYFLSRHQLLPLLFVGSELRQLAA